MKTGFVAWFKDFLNKNRIRKRLLMYFSVTMLFMCAANIFSFYTVNILLEQVTVTFKGNMQLKELQNKLNKVQPLLEVYLSSKSSEALDDYYKYQNELSEEASRLDTGYSDIDRALVALDIKNMIATYLEETEGAVNAKRGRLTQQYLAHYDESKEVYGYINDYINKLNNTLFLKNSDRYLILQNNFLLIEILDIAILIAVVIFNLLLIVVFAYKLTKPISNLSGIANEITHGNFDVPDVVVETDDEIGTMAQAFNRMTSSIREYITEIREKAELEGKLKQREMENLKMKSDLREAELHALQTQINPHFLFNTLSTGAQLAMMENADRACSFIERAAELFRYNLRNLDNPVTISDEVSNVKNYIYLLKVRFADKVEFIIHMEDSIADVLIPCLILQPVVENAFVHGLNEVEAGGR
ncbi:MAG: histidine kinase, partial [Clostridiales bacterium]|nr:histidine kinase [Clostridiales bacterium]